MKSIWNLFRTGTIVEHKPGKSAKSKVNMGEGEPLVFNYVEPFGYTSVPVAGSEAFLFSKGGSYELSYIITAADRTREKPALKSGEAAIYSDKKTYFAAKNDGTIEVNCTKKLLIKKDNEDLISLLTKIFESINTQSKAGQTPVANPQLAPLIEQLKKFST